MRSRRLPYTPIEKRVEPKRRHTYLTIVQKRLVDEFGVLLRRMFPDALGVYLVGSCVTRADFRDVDIRIILPDVEFAAITVLTNKPDLNLAISLLGERMTGLPIDCQIQDMTRANEQYPMAGNPRRPIGFGHEHAYSDSI